MTLTPLIMDLDGLCKAGQPGGAIAPSDEIISIDLPVGQGFKAKNLDSDVRTIQQALDQIKPQQGGPATPLKVDGRCGPKTNQAIHEFSIEAVRLAWHGRIDRTGRADHRQDQPDLCFRISPSTRTSTRTSRSRWFPIWAW